MKSNKLIVSEKDLSLELEELINGYVYTKEDLYFSGLVLYYKEIPYKEVKERIVQNFNPLLDYVIKKMNIRQEIFFPIGLKEIDDAVSTFNQKVDSSIFVPYVIKCLFFAFKKEF
ncbi:MAG: hypothetical protein WC839_02235 [Candidatus Paceibacterota bacterium]